MLPDGNLGRDSTARMPMRKGTDGTSREGGEGASWRERRSREWELAHYLVQVANDVGHDIGNALSTIVGRSQLALAATKDETLREDLTAILESARQGSQLTRQLQRYAQMRKEEFDPVDVSQLVVGIGDRVRSLWKDRPQTQQIHLVMEIQEDLPPILGNEADLHEALLCIVTNAVEAMSNEGTLTLRALAYPEEVSIVVEDTGPGMEMETLRRAKEAFFTTKGAPHEGLGLSVATGIALRHGGALELASTPGEVTAVSLHLPHHREGSTP
jgi:two-component system NtrC family sensor kinase